jgi:hypothetical protein
MEESANGENKMHTFRLTCDFVVTTLTGFLHELVNTPYDGYLFVAPVCGFRVRARGTMRLYVYAIYGFLES